MAPMEAAELARWTRFAAKGGIGKCLALRDCIAKGNEDLMFLQNDEIIVLMQLPQDGMYLGFCEDVVGRFSGADVRFESRLKKPVFTKRPSSTVQLSHTPTASTSSDYVARSPVDSLDFPQTRIPLAASTPASQNLPLTAQPIATKHSSVTSPPESIQAFKGELSAKHRKTVSDGTLMHDSAKDKVPHSNPASSLQRKPSNLSQKHVTSAAEPNQSNSRQELRSASGAGQLGSSDDDSSRGSHLGGRSSVGSDGEFGIGWSLLQGMVETENDRDSNIWSEEDHTQTKNVTSDLPFPTRRVPTPQSGSSHYSNTADLIGNKSAEKGMPISSPNSGAQSMRSESEVGYWDGDEDIYDDYRYSRYSVTSKASASRHSHSSTTVRVPPLPEDAPPPPLLKRQPSADSTKSLPQPRPPVSRSSSRQNSQDSVHRSGAESPTSPTSHSQPRPTPLDIANSDATSISSRHAQVTSPLLSPTPSSISPLSRDLHFGARPRSPGMASALQRKIDAERAVSPTRSSTSTASVYSNSPSKEAGMKITMEDADPSPMYSVSPLQSPIQIESLGHLAPPSPVPELYFPPVAPLSPCKRPVSPSVVVPSEPAPPANKSEVSPITTSSSNRSSSVSPTLSFPPPPYGDQSTPAPPTDRPFQNRATLPNPPMPNMNVLAYSASARAPVRSNTSPGLSSSTSLLSTLALAATKAKGALRPTTTIHGKMKTDLLSALGPVPIAFSLDGQSEVPENETPTAPSVSSDPVRQRAHSQKNQEPGLSPAKEPEPRTATLPRANFFPKVGTPRPRSRSFSGFGADFTEVPLPIQSRDQNGRQSIDSFRVPTLRSIRSASATIASPPPSTPSTPRSRSRSGRHAHVPSPLSLPAINNSAPRIPLPPSPLGQAPPISPLSPSSAKSHSPPGSKTQGSKPRTGLRHVASNTISKVGLSHSDQHPFPRQDSGPTITTSRPSSDSQSSPPRASGEPEGDNRSERIATPPLGHSASSSSSSSITRTLSLRSKLSISAIRAKGNGRATDSPSVPSGPTTPVGQEFEETVQIQDMEFELIKPVMNKSSSDLRVSEDGVVASKMSFEERAGSIRSGVSSRPQSPAISAGILSDMNSSVDSFPRLRSPNQNTQQSQSLEAHRARELRWISAMSTVASKEARKSKKIKKLVIEGVPASVRGLVWAHLTDSKARRMQNLYAQLTKRAKGPASEIERDAERCFADQPNLKDPKTIISLLQAYLAMVPDTKYSQGLILIAGNLLLQSPEEDAFWMFVAIIDTHLRGYFHQLPTQLEMDAAVFSSLVETADPQLHKRLFVDLGIRALDLCKPWFTSLFASALPTEHLHRVWDLFLFEGPVFLFRVGLTILMLCRRFILERRSGPPASVVSVLLRIPPQVLPDPETFISHAFTVKVKDDDIKKQRTRKQSTRSIAQFLHSK